MLKLFEFLTGVGAALATLVVVVAFTSNSAPQQAAAFALALCLVAIPYCVLGMLQRGQMLKRSAKRGIAPLDF